jgi:uncharacterized membrane protein
VTGPANFAVGLFVATFVHTLLAIREIDLGSGSDPGHVPGVAVLATFVLALTSIAVLVMYVHHVGQALRISDLVEARRQPRTMRESMPRPSLRRRFGQVLKYFASG